MRQTTAGPLRAAAAAGPRVDSGYRATRDNPALPSGIVTAEGASSERALLAAVLCTAVADYRNRNNRQWAHDYAAAREWVQSDDRSWPCSFHNICIALDMDPAQVRAGFARLKPVRSNGGRRRRLFVRP